MKRIAMIPARLGSTRVPKKNLRFLGDKPLIAWVTETTRDSGLFDEVWINSEAREFEDLAYKLGVKFYSRSKELAADNATSEHFVADFLNNTSCNVLFQITPTSPFLTKIDLEKACCLINLGADTVLSVKRVLAECFKDQHPVNFDPSLPMMPSQNLIPIEIMCNGIFAWQTDTFTGTYGWRGIVSKLVLEGDSTLDIDTEEDFTMAEAILLRRNQSIIKRYWSSTEYTEQDATQVLLHDGVADVNLQVNGLVNLDQLLKELPENGGARRVVERISNSATVISQMPGEGNRRHYHPDWDEWWLILEGEYEYEIEGKKIPAKRGDLISIERGQWHRIEVTGLSRATRLAVSRDKVEHVYHD